MSNTCPKCGSLLLIDLVIDVNSGSEWLSLWHCIICGSYYDSLMILNRFYSPEIKTRNSKTKYL